MAKCDGPNCDADVVWAETPAGKRQPFDRAPAEGDWILLGRGPEKAPLAIHRKLLTEDAAGGAVYEQIRKEAGYVPHHATCVDRDRFKGPRR